MNNIFSKLGLITLGLILFSSCSDNLPKNVEEPYRTDLLTIKIVNAGKDKQNIIEGIIDEENKKVTFPRIDIETDFSSLEFQATTSEGAHLEKNVMDFSMDEQESEKTLLLRVMHHKRYKDYFVQIKKKVPVFGADFEKYKTFDFSNKSMYPDYAQLKTRSADFDGNNVLIVSRHTSPHLLKVSELLDGKINPIKLDLTDVNGGTFSYNCGAIANGHIYIASLAGSKESPLNIYYWDTPTAKVRKIGSFIGKNIPESGNRYGDNLSVNIDKNGNGYMFFGDNASENVLRLSVSNHTTIENAIVLPSNKKVTAFMNVYKNESSEQFVWSGVRLPATLCDASLSPIYTMKNLPDETIGARIINFNKERYLITCSAGLGSSTKATPTLFIYNITKGGNEEEAMKIFDEASEHQPVYSFILGGSGNAAPAVQTDYYIEADKDGNDSKLLVFASRAGSGFVILEFSKKVAED